MEPLAKDHPYETACVLPLSKLTLKFYIPSWQLRSSSDIRLLRIPSFRLKSFGQRKLSPDLTPSFKLYISLQVGSKDVSFPVPVAFSSLHCDRCMCVCGAGGGNYRPLWVGLVLSALHGSFFFFSVGCAEHLFMGMYSVACRLWWLIRFLWLLLRNLWWSRVLKHEFYA